MYIVRHLVMILVLVVIVGGGSAQEMTWSPVAEASKQVPNCKGAINIAIVVLGVWYWYLREQFKGA